MLYVDDETRHEYHQSPALIQVVCQVFEGYMADRGEQAEVFDVATEEPFEIVTLTSDAEEEVIEECCHLLNIQFKRTDGLPTARLLPSDNHFIRIQVSKASDFAQPH